MAMDRDGQIDVLHSLLDIGEMLVSSGAEINRVEDTLTRMGCAYGAGQMDVFAIMSSIIVTAVFPGHREITMTRRIRTQGPTDFTKLEELNELSRECCRNPFPPKELRRRVSAIRDEEIPAKTFVTGSVIAAASFAVFFGGSLADGAAAGIFALLICRMQRHLSRITPNTVVFNLISSFTVGILIGILTVVVPFLHEDWITIGDIMLLVPGLAMTNAIRDVLVGDTLAGIMRVIESLMWAGALACGFMAAFWLLKEVGV